MRKWLTLWLWTALAVAATPAGAGPDVSLGDVKKEAALLATAPAAAAALAEALEAEFEGRASAARAADAPTDRNLFVGPKSVWIVISEHDRLAEAEEAAAAFLADDVPVKLLALRDGGYEIALGPERIGRARRALARWRREGFVGIEARLSSGAAYLSRVEPPGPESR